MQKLAKIGGFEHVSELRNNRKLNEKDAKPASLLDKDDVPEKKWDDEEECF